MMYDDCLSAARMCHVVGCTYRMLDYWIRTGAITPLVDGAGSGSRRLFSRDQVKVVLAVYLLRKAGIGMGTIDGISKIDREGAQWLASIEGSWKNTDTVVSREGPLTVTLDLGWIEDEAERLLAEYGADRVRIDRGALAGHGQVSMRGTRADLRRMLAGIAEPRALEAPRRVHSSEWAGGR